MSSIVWAAVVIGLVLLTVALVATRSAEGGGYAGRISTLLEPDGGARSEASLVDKPATRLIGGVAVVLLVVGGALVAIGDEHALIGAVTLVLVAALFAGSYVAVEKRKLSPAAALLISAAIVGTYLLLIVVMQLVELE